jgi:hypothetical protein
MFADNSFTFQGSFIPTEQTKGENGRKRGEKFVARLLAWIMASLKWCQGNLPT